METMTQTLPQNTRAAVPIAITPVASWHCHKCGGLVDETKTLIYVRRGTRTRVWHPACRT